MDNRFKYSKLIDKNIINLLLHKQIGSGSARDVYLLTTDHNLVIKIEHADYSFQNIREWELWHDAIDTPLQKWLAPVKWISKDGRALIMERTKILGEHEAPVMMPAPLTDFKYENYGMLNGKVVCHDYGTNQAATLTTKRMKKVKWWHDE